MLPQPRVIRENPIDNESANYQEANSTTNVQQGRGETDENNVVSVTDLKDLPNTGNRISRKRTFIPNSVAVLDKNKKPLQPTSPRRARELLKKQKATIHKIFPFVIRLKKELY